MEESGCPDPIIPGTHDVTRNSGSRGHLRGTGRWSKTVEPRVPGGKEGS